MKTLKTTFILLFFTTISFAQTGMIFQGIARNDKFAAIGDKNLVFICQVVSIENNKKYEETQTIKTDG